MIAARLVKANKTGFGSAVLALFLQLILAGAMLNLGPGPTLALIISVIGGAVIYAFALDTTILRGFIVSLLAGLIATAIAYLVAGSFLTGSAVLGTSPG
jgi:hypothetical protein